MGAFTHVPHFCVLLRCVAATSSAAERMKKLLMSKDKKVRGASHQ